MTREQVVQMANEAGLPALTEYGYGCLFRVIKRAREVMRDAEAHIPFDQQNPEGIRRTHQTERDAGGGVEMARQLDG